MRLRLILSFVLVVLASVGGVVYFASQGAASEVRTVMMRGGMVRLEAMGDELEAYYARQGSWEGAQAMLTLPGAGHGAGQGGMGMGMMSTVQRLVLADSRGRIVADTDNASAGGQLSAAEKQLALQLKSGWRTIGYLLPYSDSGLSQGDQSFLIQSLSQAALLAGLGGAALALLLAVYLSGRLISPVVALTQAASRMAQGDLSQRVNVRGRDEISKLGQAFNHMAGSLQQAQESRKALTADIAHELRTPLAVQRANLEALQDGVYPLSAENLAPILEQNQLLTRLVDDLRTLALADAGQLQLELTSTNLRSLAGRMTERFASQAGAAQVQLQTELPAGDCFVLADPGRVEQILSNLLSNALRHTPAGGKIHLRLACEAQNAVLSLQDSGPGIAAEDLTHIFDRFYRADKSRSRSAGGSGLGLTIARQLAEAQGGRLAAANTPGSGACFTLTLPRTNPPAES